MTTEINARVAKLKELIVQQKGLLDEIDRIKGYILEFMIKEGHKSIDARVYGLGITKIKKVNYHYDEDLVSEILRDRFEAVLSVDKKKVDVLLKDVPELENAKVKDSEKEFLQVKEVE